MLRQAILLCGGRGVRMQPLTNSTPKVMVKLAGKPLVEYLVEKLEALGVKELAMVVCYRKEDIVNYFKDRVRYYEQASPKGTADALRVARGFVKEDKFAVINGDLYFTDDLSWMLHEEPIALSVCWVEEASSYGVVEVENGLVKDIKEKALKGPGLINAGVYLFTKEVFDVIEGLEPSQRGEYELTDAIKTLIRRGVKVKAMELKGYWKDIGSLSDLKEVEEYLKVLRR